MGSALSVVYNYLILMHKCVNNTIGNVYHLEQVVDNFFPYAQKKLGFDQPVTIVFQSDEDNASKMLGKTAYYSPESLEVVLYTDNRHPKDVLRSLSHELVHHAQNCRGDFTKDSATYEGYAQCDPHLRKMEREAYTKGNLIFRDFEDLIKTGKINIEIDFSDSGEPEMSLKEWKNNEINQKLMKKWGLLKETKEEPLEEWAPGHEPLGSTHDFLGNPLKSAPKGTKAKSTRWYAGDSKPGEGDSGGSGYAHDDPESEEYHTDPALEKRREYQRWKISQGLAEAEDLEEDELEEGDPLMQKHKGGHAHRSTDTSSRERLAYEKDPAAWMSIDQAEKLGLSPEEARAAIDLGPGGREHDRGPGDGPGLGKARRKWRKAFAGQFDDPENMEEGWGWRKEDDDIDESYVDLARSRGQLHKTIDPADLEAAADPEIPDEMKDPKYWREDDPETYRGPAVKEPRIGGGTHTFRGKRKRHVAGGAEGVADFILPNEPAGEPPEAGERVWDPRHLNRTTLKVPPVSVREGRQGKISVREAREITRRIIERIKKESK